MEVTLRSKIDLRFCTGMDGTNSLICGQENFWLPITILAQPKRTLNFGYFRIQWTSHDDLIGWLRFNFLIVIFRINVDPYKNLSNHIKHLTNDFCSFFRLDRESWKYSAIIGWRLCSGWARPLPRVVPVPRKRKSGRQKFPKKTALWRFSKCCYGYGLHSKLEPKGFDRYHPVDSNFQTGRFKNRFFHLHRSRKWKKVVWRSETCWKNPRQPHWVFIGKGQHLAPVDC